MADLRSGQSKGGSRKPGESPIERAFRVLQTVVAAGESVGVLELSRRTGLPRSTVSRLVATLEDLAMVNRTADGLVFPGSALATLQPGVAVAPLLEDQLRPLLTELVQTFDENAALSIDDGDGLLYLAQVSANHPVSVPDVSGEQHRFHLVAPGLVTMAHWDADRLDQYLADELERPTETSMGPGGPLTKRLDNIRSTGWCWTDQELDVGVNGLAVPVCADGDMVATVSLFGPTYRFNPETHPEVATSFAELVGARADSLLSDSLLSDA